MITTIKPPPTYPIRPEHTTLTRATADAIRNAILAGTFAYGSQLPPEIELMDQLGVSRTTLREALKLLEQLGLINRRRGLGTFVTERSIVKDLSSNFGISAMISQAGLIPGCLEPVIQVIPAEGAIAAALNLGSEDLVIAVDRVRTANQKPAVWSLDYIPARIVTREMVIQSLQDDESLYDMVHDRCQINIVRGDAQLLPIIANTTMAGKLKVHKGTPLMCIIQTDYSSNNQAVFYSLEYHLPDLFNFRILRNGPHL
jgi:GntR family transcriptional regulator